ncbi:MAG: protein kinase [Deltaproteobacteria bacterium]|nr:protein kinase [Deltaproteobacteria bacterium]
MGDDSKHSIPVGTVMNEKYVILEFIAKGGMGEVYRSHQINLKRDVAIKIISEEWLESIKDNQEEFEVGIQRFHNEVEAMAQIRHPNILQIYDYGSFTLEEDEKGEAREYIVMEYVPGGTLRSTMSEDGFYPEEDLTKEWLREYFLPVLDGIQALHEAGIIHRDLKPGNILMDGNIPKITDFGLARSTKFKPVTQSVDVKGTPTYMSPEHFLDLRRTDHRADIYSLGKILVEAIDGKKVAKDIPFKQAGLRKAETPFFKALDRIIRTATEEDRDKRCNSVKELREAITGALGLEETKKGERVPSRERTGARIVPRRWMGAVFGTVILFVLVIGLWVFREGVWETAPFRKRQEVAVEKVNQPESPLQESPAPGKGSLREVITGRDGASMRLIPGGDFQFPIRLGGQEKKIQKVDTFYMDETEVTNHQFVEFLNRVIKKISVGEGVVRGEGKVWLLLGEVTEGYEPIVYSEGSFRVKDPAFHSHPVVRVTPEGAAAYAGFFGRRLPSELEWLYAEGGMNVRPVGQAGASPGPDAPTGHMEMMEQMHGQGAGDTPGQEPLPETPLPVVLSKPNSYGVKGLDGNVNEWARRGSRYVVMPSGIPRNPWEAFEEVGFRTVLGVK